jgi:hypothetical protein
MQAIEKNVSLSTFVWGAINKIQVFYLHSPFSDLKDRKRERECVCVCEREREGGHAAFLAIFIQLTL